MSDGPHKSLPMPRAWKRVAECADNIAFTPEQMSIALAPALQQDWKAEISESALNRLQEIVSDKEVALFGDHRVDRLQEERVKAAGKPLACVLIDCAIQAITHGGLNGNVLVEAAEHAICDRAARRARQVEEHYMRQSNGVRAEHVRDRLVAGVMETDFRSLATSLSSSEYGNRTYAMPKHDGLDDGVKF